MYSVTSLIFLQSDMSSIECEMKLLQSKELYSDWVQLHGFHSPLEEIDYRWLGYCENCCGQTLSQ